MRGQLKSLTGNSSSGAEHCHLGDKQALLSETSHVKAFENNFSLSCNGLSVKKKKKERQTVYVAHFDESNIETECWIHSWFKLLDYKQFLFSELNPDLCTWVSLRANFKC